MSSYRKTKSVKTILDKFELQEEALSVVDLVEGFQQVMCKTTVYRILDRLEESGVLHSFIGGNGRKWYAKCKAHIPSNQAHIHPHFQCKTCGKVECLPLGIAIPSFPHHKIDSAAFLLTGDCEQCLAQP